MKHLAIIWLACGAILQLHAQGYVVPNGVVYSGLSLNGVGYGINVVHNPTNMYYTGFTLEPTGKTPPTIYTNTYLFYTIVDVSVRVFMVQSNQSMSLSPILLNSYTELAYGPSYVFNSGVPFYLGLYTGNDLSYPPNGIYIDPLFGWVKLVNNQGVIQMLDSALAYKAQGILVGTQTLIPEPGVLSLFGLGGLLLGFRRSRWQTLNQRRTSPQ